VEKERPAMTSVQNSTASAIDDGFRQIVESSPFGVLRIDADFRVVSASRGARQTLSTVDALIGKDCGDLLRTVWPEPFASEAISRVRRTLATGEPFRSRATIERRKDRPAVESYDWVLHRLEMADGRHEVVCHFYDLSERYRQEDGLRTADRRKDEWVATLAHELRSPLAPIRVAAALLRAASANHPEIRQYATVIDRQSTQMARLLDDLLEVSRLSRGGLVLHVSTVALRTVIDDAIETSRPIIEAARQNLVTEVDPACLVKGDATRLTQVFVNLLNNAAKYGYPDGQITVHGARVGRDVVVRVRDTGIGIDGSMFDRIFDLFEQADDVRNRSMGGLGIGLALVKSVVAYHGGTVAVSSDGPARGSEFIVRLPAYDPTGPAHHAHD
jgi:Signal transduction histidine kinase